MLVDYWLRHYFEDPKCTLNDACKCTTLGAPNEHSAAKICQKCPRIKAEVLCWTGRGAKMHEDQLALLPVSCLSWQSCSGVWSAFTIAGISITRASTQQSYCSLRATLHQSIIIVLSVHTMTSSSSSSSSCSECNVEQILDRPCNPADRLLARRLLPRKRLLSFSALPCSTPLHSALLCSTLLYLLTALRFLNLDRGAINITGHRTTRVFN